MKLSDVKQPLLEVDANFVGMILNESISGNKQEIDTDQLLAQLDEMIVEASNGKATS